MTILSSKWMLAGLALLAILLILFVMGKKEVKTSIVINASTDQVWQALSSPEKIKEWNTVLIPLSGEFKEGTMVQYNFVQDENSSTQLGAKVVKIEPKRLINQEGGPVGILTFNHSYILEPDGDLCRVTIHEKYRGIMVPFWNPNAVEKAYERLLQQLKNHVENE
ncbi:SRPBCC family protein [bacterium SCSIO 12741]|nr:SRPBCC family protein [bacterium SCSIO 12741]